MANPSLSDAEQKYLETLRKLPTSLRSRLLGWALELLPSIALFVWGLISDSRVFLVLGFVSLLYFTVWRMYQPPAGLLRLRPHVVPAVIAGCLTPRWSGRVRDKVPSSNGGARAAQLNR